MEGNALNCKAHTQDVQGGYELTQEPMVSMRKKTPFPAVPFHVVSQQILHHVVNF